MNVLANIEKHNQELHRRMIAIAERTGKSILELAEEGCTELVDRLLNDHAALAEFRRRLDQQQCPFGPDPTLSGGAPMLTL